MAGASPPPVVALVARPPLRPVAEDGSRPLASSKAALVDSESEGIPGASEDGYSSADDISQSSPVMGESSSPVVDSFKNSVPVGTSLGEPNPEGAAPATGKTDTLKPGTGNWKNLFVDNRSMSADAMLSHFADISISRSCVLLETDAHNDVWKRCLIGYVAGKYPGFLALKSIISNIWKCEANLSIHESGWIVYKFNSDEDKLEVLNKGPT